MKRFIQRFADKITGVLSGFDRLVFRGTLRYIAHRGGMMDFLYNKKVLLKEFGSFAQEATERLKEASCEKAKQEGRPIEYLASSQVNKEEVALEIARRDEVKEGLIAVLSCVEPCMSYDIHRDRERKQLELVLRERKCKFLYHYWIDPEFGFMNARIQTWLPFHVQICLNGREWLARQMDRIRLEYRRSDNCFVWVKDFNQAAKLLQDQLKISWATALNRIARMLNPAHLQIFKGIPVSYYWSTYQSEWATDLTFRSSTDLAEIYPQLVVYGITAFSSSDVMRFLGKKVSGAFQGQIVSDFKGTGLKEFESNTALAATPSSSMTSKAVSCVLKRLLTKLENSRFIVGVKKIRKANTNGCECGKESLTYTALLRSRRQPMKGTSML